MAYKVQKLNKKMLEAINIMVQEPNLSGVKIAERLGVHYRTIHNYMNSPIFQEKLEEELKKEWKDARRIAQKRMIEKAENGNMRALEYILSSNGYQAPQQIEVNQNTIKVTIEENDRP